MKLELFGIPFDNLTSDEALARVDEFALSTGTKVMTAINAAKVVSIQQNHDQRRAVRESDLVLADGVPVVWASRLAGKPLKQRVAGCDFFQEVVRHGQPRGYRFFLLGGRPDVVEKVKEVLEQRHPGVQIVGWRDGYFSIDDEKRVVDEINRSKATILFLGFSSPKKEEFVLRNRHRLETVRFIQGVGGSFDIVAGVTKRAPEWMQGLGLEWLYRLMQEPRRMWRRYLVTNTLFVWLTIRELLRGVVSREGA
jgi:N-acetylglucosaminyldiphosphoundecaprenol N-acetyl-beta-D-mannosaminyltransferase